MRMLVVVTGGRSPRMVQICFCVYGELPLGLPKRAAFRLQSTRQEFIRT